MTVRIKKYANRKLHAVGDTKYLSMLELADRAAKDSDIQVVCDRTGRDLTLETLSRALYERLKDYFDEDRFIETGRNKALPFPVSELTKLIALVPARKKA
jgi:polyhydroxyalkanoate synthesis regulator protein